MTISPAPGGAKTLFSVPDQSNTIAIDPYALDPDATYTATIGANVKDVFGQTLGSEQRVTIRTSDFAAGAWAPSGTNVIPAGAPIALNFYATNLPGNAYQAAYAQSARRDFSAGPTRSRCCRPSNALAGANARRRAAQRAERRARSAARRNSAARYGSTRLRFPHGARLAELTPAVPASCS